MLQEQRVMDPIGEAVAAGDWCVMCSAALREGDPGYCGECVDAILAHCTADEEAPEGGEC